jgi:hypothetical protein
MEQSRFRRRLVAWVCVGVLLAAVTAVVGMQDGAGAAWGLGAILATVYSGTFAFIEPTLIKRSEKR